MVVNVDRCPVSIDCVNKSIRGANAAAQKGNRDNSRSVGDARPAQIVVCRRSDQAGHCGAMGITLLRTTSRLVADRIPSILLSNVGNQVWVIKLYPRINDGYVYPRAGVSKIPRGNHIDILSWHAKNVLNLSRGHALTHVE